MFAGLEYRQSVTYVEREREREPLSYASGTASRVSGAVSDVSGAVSDGLSGAVSNAVFCAGRPRAFILVGGSLPVYMVITGVTTFTASASTCAISFSGPLGGSSGGLWSICVTVRVH
jgi:hypothetical protein